MLSFKHYGSHVTEFIIDFNVYLTKYMYNETVMNI